MILDIRLFHPSLVDYIPGVCSPPRLATISTVFEHIKHALATVGRLKILVWHLYVLHSAPQIHNWHWYVLNTVSQKSIHYAIHSFIMLQILLVDKQETAEVAGALERPRPAIKNNGKENYQRERQKRHE